MLVLFTRRASQSAERDHKLQRTFYFL